jgi:hypothetical protein
MTTIRACTTLAAALRAGVTAAMLAVTIASSAPALADPPAKPAADPKAAPKADPKANPKADNKTDKPAAKPDPSEKTEKTEKKELLSDADARRFSDFFDKLVAIVIANQEDCVKMAAGVNGHIDANQAVINVITDPKNKDKRLPPAVEERIQKKARDELTPAITKKCAQDKAVEAAFNRMGAGGGK